MVAYAVGAPAERQFAQIAGAQYQSVSIIGDSEEVRCSLAGLDVFKGDVVNGLSFCKWVADIPKHLHAARTDVDLVDFNLQRFHKAQGISIGFVRCRESRQ